MAVGKSVIRKEARDKVTGRAKYTNDFKQPGMLHAALVTSPYAHARIASIETSAALAAPGVRAVLTGEGLPLTGEDMRDRPPIAADKVRYFGEVVAVVVADTLAQAEQAARLIRVAYEPLPAVGSPREALKEGAPLLHEHLDRYEKTKRLILNQELTSPTGRKSEKATSNKALPKAMSSSKRASLSTRPTTQRWRRAALQRKLDRTARLVSPPRHSRPL